MIALVHILFGAAIGYSVKYLPLAIVLALLGHYFLDVIPHVEYPTKTLEKNQFKPSVADIAKILADLGLGILLVFVFSKNNQAIYICAFFGVLPDLVYGSRFFFKNNRFLNWHEDLHEKVHFLKENKKFSTSWRILFQIIAAALSIYILKL